MGCTLAEFEAVEVARLVVDLFGLLLGVLLGGFLLANYFYF
jgi:hypothetical protein